MKAEKYLYDYMMKHDISVQLVEAVIGIDIEQMVISKKELKADEFMKLCIYLGVNPDDVMKDVV